MDERKSKDSVSMRQVRREICELGERPVCCVSHQWWHAVNVGVLAPRVGRKGGFVSSRQGMSNIPGNDLRGAGRARHFGRHGFPLCFLACFLSFRSVSVSRSVNRPGEC